MQRFASTKIVLLAAAMSSLTGCGQLSSSSASKNSGSTEEKYDPTTDLNDKGFALFPGDLLFDFKGAGGISRFSIQLLDDTQGPVVGASLSVKRLASKADNFAVLDHVKKANSRSNVFTVWLSAGKEFEVSASADGFATASKSLVFDSAKPVNVAFPLTLKKAADAGSGSGSGSMNPDDQAVNIGKGLKYCDVRTGDDDFKNLMDLIQKNLPDDYKAINDAYLAKGEVLFSCDGTAYPAVTLVFSKGGMTPDVYTIKDASALKDYYYANSPDAGSGSGSGSGMASGVTWERPGAKVGNDKQLAALHECNAAGYYYDRGHDTCDKVHALAEMNCTIDGVKSALDGQPDAYSKFHQLLISNFLDFEVDQCVTCKAGDNSSVCSHGAGGLIKTVLGAKQDAGTQIFLAKKGILASDVKSIWLDIDLSGAGGAAGSGSSSGSGSGSASTDAKP